MQIKTVRRKNRLESLEHNIVNLNILEYFKEGETLARGQTYFQITIFISNKKTSSMKFRNKRKTTKIKFVCLNSLSFMTLHRIPCKNSNIIPSIQKCSFYKHSLPEHT